MTAETPLITDPALLSVLKAAAQAQQQSLAILDLLDEYHSRESGEENADSIEPQLAVSKQQKHLYAHLAHLRGLNRRAIINVRATKQGTAERRQEVDSLHLQLQNLYYEQRHLRGEIAACEDFDHKYTTLPLVPLEGFLAQHPEYANSDGHDITVARIEDEHRARQALEEQRQVLLKRKDVLVKETTAKKDELIKLDTEIEKWLDSEKSIRKVFDTRSKKLSDAKEKAEEEAVKT
ncbi:hypothetical protein K431DRAFT_215629 [Polychaeton citri CBS 116435]|uniref:THOC5 family protein n=1 Tax=Polychaeton citri CBS 116435 TaxID=1314669 RepID=A0A9P4QJ31_9PEZI|nr:hypothetical protein K431DRAFT_215629 [Polychaeton citri CBS 116435]